MIETGGRSMTTEIVKDGELIRLPNGNLIEKEQLHLRDAAPDMLAALQAVAPLLATALKAYQFGASSYTYAAMVDCMKVRDIALAAIEKATEVPNLSYPVTPITPTPEQ
jgi:hypothetical protein